MAGPQYECTHCGYVSSVKLGRCPQCGSFNSFVERPKIEEDHKFVAARKWHSRVIGTFLAELNELLGGGLPSGSAILLGGEPGIGKSTLALQILGGAGCSALYITAEETAEQVRDRASRLGLGNVQVVRAESLEGVNFDNYELVCVDSMQMISADGASALGSPNTVKEVVGALVAWAKESNGVLILIAHVTKEGLIAGPKTVEHMVDVVMYLEGERSSEKRILRVVKNRYGPSTDQILLEMTEKGLLPADSRIEVGEGQPGLAVSAVDTGTKLQLVRVHALVTESFGPVPKRVSSRYPLNRLLLMTAVMQKYLKVPLYKYDIYVDVSTDFFVNDFGVDLAVVGAIYSSLKNRPLPQDLLLYGEVLLTGDIRVPRRRRNLDRELSRLGIGRIEAPSVVQLFKELNH
ncbi:DNA repair protein RadA [Coprothermobacteraceae bacterium]|nr:DNA repair protein RadA [Coprothermobacteraceae bacterium]